MSPEIAEPVKRLIAEAIGSVSELEAILLLRQHRGRSWTLAEAEERLYVHRDDLALLFGRLVNRGFLVLGEGRYLYAAAPDLDETVHELASLYAQRVVEVTNLIHADTARKVLELVDAAQWSRKE